MGSLSHLLLQEDAQVIVVHYLIRESKRAAGIRSQLVVGKVPDRTRNWVSGQIS